MTNLILLEVLKAFAFFLSAVARTFQKRRI